MEKWGQTTGGIGNLPSSPSSPRASFPDSWSFFYLFPSSLILAGGMLRRGACRLMRGLALDVISMRIRPGRFAMALPKALITSLAQRSYGYLWFGHGLWLAALRWRSRGPVASSGWSCSYPGVSITSC